MKVAIVHAEWLPVPPALGGPIEQTLYETALGIKDPELTVISRWHTSLKAFGKGPARVFYHVDIEGEKERIKQTLGQQASDAVNQDYFAYLNGATDLLHKIDPDVIQVHNRPEFVPYMLKQFPNKQVVLYMHGEAKYLGCVETPLDDVIGATTAFVFVSQFLADRFVERYPASGKKVRVIHNSVDTDVWHPRVQDVAKTQKVRKKYGLKPGRTVLFVGRTVYEKGVHCLLEAMVYVRCHLPDAKLLVVGSPFFEMVAMNPFLENLKHRATVLGDGVVFSGYVPHDKTPYLYGAADVTAVPSVWEEPFGKVVTESMSTGVPVVASRRGGIPEIVSNGQDGILVDDPEDTKALGAVLVDLLLNSERRKAMGEVARKTAELRFAKPIRLRKIKTFYKVLGKGDGLKTRRPKVV